VGKSILGEPPLVNQETIKTATKIDQCSHANGVAALTNQYVELSLPPKSALRAAEADRLEHERQTPNAKCLRSGCEPNCESVRPPR
jgi:hypothetical protein